MKDLKISKELLQCLNKHLTIDEVISNDKNRIDNNIYWSVKEIDILQSKNIYELAYKCKEWAFKKNYTIVDGIDGIGEDICYIMKISGYSLESCYEQGKNYHNVFKACEWILENLNEKNLK